MTYIPKSATQRISFLSKYPEYDGRGIKIAIIDSAVDVSLTGLQKTSEGLPKIIDCFDFTEAGNVDTSVIREMDSENVLFGLSGLKSLYKPILTTPKEVPEKFPEMDCIVWFNGEKWQACIETFGEDLEDAKILTNFRDEHEYGVLPSNYSNFCYCITVHKDGDLLEIFTPYCNHGSIVAQIAAAHFPDESDFDGLAPGAQIISMNVLDPEKEYLMTKLAVEKALLKCIEMKCDIVNYSLSIIGGYSEIELLIEEMAKNHNILIFKSSGNCGPFYSSINKQDVRIRDYMFTIGAFKIPDMQKYIYHINVGNDYPSQIVSTFSSRGPDKNGNQGIDFIAHGTVFTDIPKFDSFDKFFSGTSFASPNAAGLIACLLSALKANFIEYSPEMIKFVLFKTAKLLEIGNKLEFGHGIIQIDSAFDYCKTKMDPISTHLWSLKETKTNINILQRAKNENIRKFILEFPFLSKFMTDKTDAKLIFELSKEAKQFIELSKTDSEASIAVKIDTRYYNIAKKNFFSAFSFFTCQCLIINIKF